MIKSNPKITIRINASGHLNNYEMFIAWRHHDYILECYKTYRHDGPATTTFMYDRSVYIHGHYKKPPGHKATFNRAESYK